MFGSKSPVEDAYHQAVYNRLLSMIYSALNYGVSPEQRKIFRKDWNERGSFQLAELLLRCAHPDWASYAETFWMNPWIAKHLLACDAGSLCHFIDQWLDDQPLPQLVSEDPLVEDRKVKDLERLFSALNR
jgi:hypothetical protein